MLRSSLRLLRSLVDRSLAKTLPWDGKLDRLEGRLERLETLTQKTFAQLNLALPDLTFVEQMFVAAHGYIPDLDAPRTFNEKLAWTKLHRRQPIYSELADKSRCKPWVRQRLGPEFVIDSLAEYDSVDEIDFAALPASFIIKPSHGSGWTVVVRDKTAVDIAAIRTQLHGWMTSNYFLLHREPQYRTIVPKLVVEPLLLDASGNLPVDYKFHCFHGRVEFVQVDLDRHTQHKRNFYDRHWELQPFNISPTGPDGGPRYPNGPQVEPPKPLPILIEIAEKLAAPFDHVRVDLYLVSNRILFGELTFLHEGANAPFFPRKWDRIWGDLWHLNPTATK